MPDLMAEPLERVGRPKLITKITGQLAALQNDTLTLKIDAFEYEVLIPEFTRRQLQSEMNQRSACTRSSTSKATRCRAA